MEHLREVTERSEVQQIHQLMARVVNLIDEIDGLTVIEISGQVQERRIIIYGGYRRCGCRITFTPLSDASGPEAFVQMHLVDVMERAPAAFVECLRECTEAYGIDVGCEDAGFIIGCRLPQVRSSSDLVAACEHIVMYRRRMARLLMDHIDEMGDGKHIVASAVVEEAPEREADRSLH